MRSASILVIAGMGLFTLSACSRHPEVSVLDKRLAVVGAPAGIARFVALQESRRPVLSTSVPISEPDGKLKIIVTLPVTFTGADLIHTTREALAAGLSYSYTEQRATHPG